jgi:hypothetical protein
VAGEEQEGESSLRAMAAAMGTLAGRPGRFWKGEMGIETKSRPGGGLEMMGLSSLWAFMQTAH